MAANASQATTTRPVTPSAAESTDGPVLNVINKRLRALRKKNNRIMQMEESVAQGKVLNKEQEETLRSKTVVLAQIDELEKLKQPLGVAVAEEHSFAVKKYLESEAEKEARVSADEGYVVVEEIKEDQKEEDKEDDLIGVVGDVLKLVYFGSIFDVKQQSEFASMMLTRTHERGCCLTYDYVTDDAVDVLGEKDLDFISQLGSFLTSRPMDSSLSHKDALERCVEHAKLWLANSDQPIGSDAGITYAGLRQRLNKIMASEYFTTTPEMTAPVDVAAAAAGNYGSYQAPAQEPNVKSQGEGNVAKYDQQSVMQDEVGHYKEENGVNELNNVDGGHKEEIATDHYEVSSLQEQAYTQSDEQNQKDADHHVQRIGIGYQNQGYQNRRGGRGGGRGGSNGRGFRGGSKGDGPYQNGRNQYFDQPGNYHPRNNNSGRGRGGRGAGGHGYNQYRSNTHAGHPDTGVAS